MSKPQSSPASLCLYRFGPYEVDSLRNQLRKFGRRVRLEPKPLRLLLFLLQHSGELVPRETLRNALWGDGIFVDFEHGLNVAVKKLRAALCDSADEPQYIETVPGEGYRFVAHVEQIVSPASAPEATLPDPKQPEAGSIAAGTVPEAGGGRAVLNPPTFWSHATWWLAPAAMVCLAAGLIVFAPHAWITASRSASASHGKIMLVVLPFENLSGDPAQEYFSDGMTEELSEQLGNLDPQRLGVIGRTSAMAYKQSPRSIRQIGNDLGVDYVLEGSVRREGSTLRVTAQLVQVPDQSHVWARHYDRDARELLQVENDVAAEIARQVQVSIALDRPADAAPSHVPSPEAHEAYFLGRYYWYKRTPEGWKTGERYFRAAIEKDPQYAAAYAGLAESLPPPDEALAAARKAVELNPRSGEARLALGWVQLYRELDIRAAKDTLEAAVRLDPNYAPAHHTYGDLLGLIGRLPEATREKQQALLLDPLFHICRASLARLLSEEGQYDQAQEQINKIFAIDPRFPKAHEVLGYIYMGMGKYADAIRELELSHEYGGIDERAPVGYAYARSGNRRGALRIRAELQKLEQAGGGVTADLAIVEIGMGNHNRAISLLEKEYQEHTDDGLLALKVDPMFDSLRPDPHFQELMHRINFPD